MSRKRIPRRNKTTARTHELKEAIVASFANPGDGAVDGLRGFSDADWKSVLWWLDMSGLAIYFLAQSLEIGAANVLPEWMSEDLAQRFSNNRIRTAALRAEACELARCLEDGAVRYALLKGITLTPDAVPDSAMRCQADLDVLVARRNIWQAIHSVQRLGYGLQAVSGDTLEFRAGEASIPEMGNLYSVRTQRALELHTLAETDGQSSLLKRRWWRTFDDTPIAVLSPPDILVQQAKHLLKHLCGEYTRLAWILEFRRHVQARCVDETFWRTAERVAAGEKNGDLAMGIALWVAEEFFGRMPMELPQQWSPEALPARVLLWLKRYARVLLMGDALGSKLYALLRKEMPRGGEQERSTGEILFPRYLPTPIMRPRPRERLAERLERYAVETDFFFRRLEFHVVEGVRFGIEAPRWRRAAERCVR
jgi:hypothetical protein